MSVCGRESRIRRRRKLFALRVKAENSES
jgi:hypothetical protein